MMEFFNYGYLCYSYNKKTKYALNYIMGREAFVWKGYLDNNYKGLYGTPQYMQGRRVGGRLRHLRHDRLQNSQQLADGCGYEGGETP